KHRGEPFRLCLVGDGSVRHSIRRQARGYHLGKQITFAGQVTPKALGDWYRAADITVLSSRSEGLPNVLRESHACGTPFVAADVGGVAELAEPCDVLVAPENS